MSTYAEVSIRKLENGYLIKVDSLFSKAYIANNFKEVMERLANHFEESSIVTGEKKP
ncbi:MAG: hypothetical protein PHC63_07005 [Candidatus Bathyarchaeota archaeon]|nr:hypothetical protein [Candidatus Bathyarchaeota archaeon]